MSSEPHGLELYGVVSLLDGRHGELLRDLWRELEFEFGFDFGDRYVPHFSFHVAERYDLPNLDARLRRHAEMTVAFNVATKGLLVFPTPEAPLFFLPLPRVPQLAGLHEVLWADLAPIAEGVYERYAADVWVPTLALTPDIERDVAPELLRFLVGRDLEWDVRVDNVSLLHDTGVRQEVAARYGFGGG